MKRFEIWWCDGWNSDTQEPVGSAVFIESVGSAAEAAVSVSSASAIWADRFGPGEAVVLDAILTEEHCENVRIDHQRRGVQKRELVGS